MNLQTLEKQRIKIYKQYLKQQIQKNSKTRQAEHSYQRKKQQANVNELIGRLNEEDLRRLEERRNMAVLLRDVNTELSQLKKSGVYAGGSGSGEEGGLAGQRNNSFLDRLNKQEIERINRNRQTYATTTHDNTAQQHAKKDIQNQIKQIDLEQQQKHLKRLKQMQQNSQKNYSEIKRKHQQNMKLYNLHSNLMHQNEQYRRMAEKFTECDIDIISKLKRNQSAERKRVLRRNQEILMSQMGEFNERRSMERSLVLEGQDINRSIFRNLLHGSPDNRKEYGEQLRVQIEEMETRKSGEKSTMKEKYRINGIFGGEQGRERLGQIQYIDRKMGLSPRINKSISVDNEEDYEREKERERESDRYRKNQQPSIDYSVNMDRMGQAEERGGYSEPEGRRKMISQAVINLPISNSKEESIQVYKPVKRMGSDAEKYQEVTDHQQNSPSSPNFQGRLFKSYDLVTGKPKFYT